MKNNQKKHIFQSVVTFLYDKRAKRLRIAYVPTYCPIKKPWQTMSRTVPCDHPR